jgi:DNA-binding transcriptional ArsR family regulator
MGVMTEALAQATTLAHPDRSAIQIESVLHALADPIRLRIVRELARVGDEGIACGTVELPVTKSTRTHHFRILREAGVVYMRPLGTSRISTLRRDDLDALYPGLLDSILTAAH